MTLFDFWGKYVIITTITGEKIVGFVVDVEYWKEHNYGLDEHDYKSNLISLQRDGWVEGVWEDDILGISTVNTF